MNEQDFKDVAYVLSAMGLIISRGVCTGVSEDAWAMAQYMWEYKNKEPEAEVGIVAAKPRRKKSAET